MPFLMMSTGHVIETTDSYASIKTKMTTGSEGELTVKGQPMFFRFEEVVSLAQTYDQIVPVGVIPPAVP